MIQIIDLCKTYDEKKVLENVSLTIQKGECIGIIGPNGSGKTTLLNAILGIIDIDSGSIEISPQCKIGFAYGDSILYEDMSVEINLKVYCILSNIKRKERETSIKYCLDYFGLTSLRKKKVKKLSAGMKKRLSLAIAELKTPNILLLDEPLNELDAEYSGKLIDLIKMKTNAGGSVLLTTHQTTVFEQVVSRWISFKDGRICK